MLFLLDYRDNKRRACGAIGRIFSASVSQCSQVSVSNRMNNTWLDLGDLPLFFPLMITLEAGHMPFVLREISFFSLFTLGA